MNTFRLSLLILIILINYPTKGQGDFAAIIKSKIGADAATIIANEAKQPRTQTNKVLIFQDKIGNTDFMVRYWMEYDELESIECAAEYQTGDAPIDIDVLFSGLGITKNLDNALYTFFTLKNKFI